MTHRLPENWTLFDTQEAMAQALTGHILAHAQKAISERGAFHFLTAGGRTPKRCYQLLSEANAEWSKWYVYMGDERVAPLGHVDRNRTDLDQAWLNHSDIPESQRIYMPTELGLEASAQAYEQAVSNIEFDLTLLGAGEDGHTASLFPGHTYPSGQNVVQETDSPKPPKERISLSFEALSHSKCLIKLVSGESKLPMVTQWLNVLGNSRFPIAQAEGQNTLVFITQDAVPQPYL